MNKYFVILLSFVFLFASCKKQDKWLDKKSNKSDIVPVTMEDFRSLLNNDAVFNAEYPGIGIIGSDNFYITFSSWQSRQAAERNAYTWQPDIYEGDISFDWSYAYQRVAYANIILEGLEKINPDSSDRQEKDELKGSALFLRSYAFFNLVQLFAKPYDKNTASVDPGIPLRIHSDVNEHYSRASIRQTYDRILQDLQEADSLLPVTVGSSLLPSKLSAKALLARISLTMENYQEAVRFADEALVFRHDLIDFNTLDTTSGLPFPDLLSGNKEVLFYSTVISYGTIASYILKVDTLLYLGYSPNDLRRVIYFRNNGGSISLKGDYAGNSYSIFGGLAINELFLIRAESNARMNKVEEAMNDLNTLLINRWKTGTFNPLTASNAGEALGQIITERRKELPFVGNLRWEDLRRLNKDSRFQKTLVRILNNETFTLPPNDIRYTYPIPDNEISLSGLEQNPR